MEHASRNVSILEAVSAFIDFHVDKSVLNKMEEEGVAMAVGDFTGLQLMTKIKSNQDDRLYNVTPRVHYDLCQD